MSRSPAARRGAPAVTTAGGHGARVGLLHVGAAAPATPGAPAEAELRARMLKKYTTGLR